MFCPVCINRFPRKVTRHGVSYKNKFYTFNNMYRHYGSIVEVVEKKTGELYVFKINYLGQLQLAEPLSPIA